MVQTSEDGLLSVEQPKDFPLETTEESQNIIMEPLGNANDLEAVVNQLQTEQNNQIEIDVIVNELLPSAYYTNDNTVALFGEKENIITFPFDDNIIDVNTDNTYQPVTLNNDHDSEQMQPNLETIHDFTDDNDILEKDPSWTPFYIPSDSSSCETRDGNLVDAKATQQKSTRKRKRE